MRERETGGGNSGDWDWRSGKEVGAEKRGGGTQTDRQQTDR